MAITKKLVLPVIHVGGGRYHPSDASIETLTESECEQMAMRNATLAFEEGADGVFVINHGYRDDLIELAKRIKADNGGKWVGINWLGEEPHALMKRVSGLDGLWSDHSGINEDKAPENQEYPEYVRLLQLKYQPNLLYFGACAFKSQPATDNGVAACVASPYMDYACTSGSGTGVAANLKKIKEVKKNATIPVAIASGITPENVETYLPYADAFLVATGISRDFFNLDRAKVADLVTRVRTWERQAHLHALPLPAIGGPSRS